MAFVKTDLQKNKILKNDKNKLREQISAKHKELHLRGLKPIHGQDEYQQLKDLKNEAGHIQDIMTKSKEERERKKAEQKKAKRKTFNQQLKMYLSMQERKGRENYEKRKIVLDGFHEYEDTIKMPKFKVLLKEHIKKEINGIFIPDEHKEKYPVYTVLAKGEDCDQLNVGDNVIAEAYTGIEVKDKEYLYRIINVNNIICIIK